MAGDTSEAGNVEALRQEKSKQIAVANLGQLQILIDPITNIGWMGLPSDSREKDIIIRSLQEIDISIQDMTAGESGTIDSITKLSSMDGVAFTNAGVQKLSAAGINHPVVNAFRGRVPSMGRG